MTSQVVQETWLKKRTGCSRGWMWCEFVNPNVVYTPKITGYYLRRDQQSVSHKKAKTRKGKVGNLWFNGFLADVPLLPSLSLSNA